MELLSGKGLCINKCLDLAVDVQAINGLQKLSSKLLVLSSNEPASKTTSLAMFPFPLNVSEMKISLLDPKARAIFKDIKVDDTAFLCCGSLHCADANGSSMSMVDISANFRPDVSVLVGTVLMLQCPDMIELSAPVSNLAINFKDGTLWLASTSVQAMILKETTTNSKDEGNIDVSIPFPVHILLDELRLSKCDSSTAFYIDNIDMMVSCFGAL